MKHLLLSIFLASLLKISTGADWCYQTQVSCTSHCKGPDVWHQVNGECGRTKQSPINIVTRKTVLDERLKPFTFTGYQDAFTSIIKNNGHSVAVNVATAATVSGGNLGDTYKAVQFHLHWGANGGPGSEHTIDGEQYPMELHIVHMKQKYSSLADALKDSTGVAVLGFFYEESKGSNQRYDVLIDALKKVQTTNTNTTLSLSLDRLILSSQNMTNYYRYYGSLTTPDCTESVVWTVFEHPIPLSQKQLTEFSKLKFHDGSSMVGTFRPVQPWNGRLVHRSGATATLASATTVLLLALTVAMGLTQTH